MLINMEQALNRHFVKFLGILCENAVLGISSDQNETLNDIIVSENGWSIECISLVDSVLFFSLGLVAEWSVCGS